MFKYLIFCLLLLSGASAVGCVDKTEAEGPCNIKLHVCPDTYDSQVVYKTKATDLKSGIQADNSAGQHFHSSTGSGEDANWNLYNRMIVAPSNTTSNATDPCNCFTSVEQLGPKCILQATICFYFITVQDLIAPTPVPAFKAWTYDEQTAVTGYSDNAAGHNVTQAVLDSIIDLIKQEPSLIFRCPTNETATLSLDKFHDFLNY